MSSALADKRTIFNTITLVVGLLSIMFVIVLSPSLTFAQAGMGPGLWHAMQQAATAGAGDVAQAVIEEVADQNDNSGDKPKTGTSSGMGGSINDEEIRCAAHKLLTLMEGNLGALVMVVAGIGTIIASAFGAYRAATSLLVVALGAFVLRSFVVIFFNFNENVPDGCGTFERVGAERTPGT